MLKKIRKFFNWFSKYESFKYELVEPMSFMTKCFDGSVSRITFEKGEVLSLKTLKKNIKRSEEDPSTMFEDIKERLGVNDQNFNDLFTDKYLVNRG